MPVRFVEGVTHGFLVLRTVEGVLIASGDLLQKVRRAEVESRMVFRFKDGSLLDETVVFSQEGVFTLQSYRLLQQGPVYPEDTEISLKRASGKYRVKTTPRGGARETVHIVAFTPAARLITLEVTQVGEHKVLVGELTKTAVHYVFKPQLGLGLTLFAAVLGRLPADSHAWVVTDEVPAFVRFEGPLHATGAVWRIELTSPRWPD